MSPVRTCVIVASDITVTAYAERWLARGHEIRALVTDSADLCDWAAGRQIPRLDAGSDLGHRLAEVDHDYLFAITYLSLLPNAVLALPKELAINIHGGPLPRYAGLNSPSWGILSGEREFGITWHVMTGGADEGDIVKQSVFPISDRETALSLNTKCFTAAVDAFEALIVDIETGNVRSKAQDLSGRSYFGRYDRPAAACTLDWNRPAGDLDALIRALTFERNANVLGSAKILSGRAAITVLDSEVLPTDPSSQDAPGTVRVEGDFFDVACADGTLRVLRTTDLFGRPLTPDRALAVLDLAPGSQLPLLSSQQTGSLTAVNAELCRSERFWVDRLEASRPPDVPWVSQAAVGAVPKWEVVDGVALSTPHGQPDRADPTLDPLVVIAAYIARVTSSQRFDIAFADDSTRRVATLGAPYVHDWVPLRVTADPGRTFSALREAIAAEVSLLGDKGGFLKDVIARFPTLAGNPDLRLGSLGPIAVERLGKAGEHGEPPPGAALAFAVSADGGSVTIRFDANRVRRPDVATIEDGLRALAESARISPDPPIGTLNIMSEGARSAIVRDFNDTEVPFEEDATIHGLFERQVRRTPTAVAVVFDDQELTYSALNGRANQLARHLIAIGVNSGEPVGIYLDRSADMLVAALAAMKSGGAYLPLDPAYPSARTGFMVEDSGIRVIICSGDRPPPEDWPVATLVRIDTDGAELESLSADDLDPRAVRVSSNDLAYTIYTSGSTGQPKGVLIEHRNVANFFTGMDARIDHPQGSTLLAVTSLSFDISVLELFWSLSNGFKIVIYREADRDSAPRPLSSFSRPIDFSLFYFASGGDGESANRYRLLLEGARFGDENGFCAVWTPERHFHEFGGLYPNPAVTGAAIAATTKRIGIRAGSCVLPLHDPIRVAEEWSVVDNLSGGRVAIAFASGWQPNDFVLKPENFGRSKDVLYDNIDVVRRLWRGDSISFPGPLEEPVEVRTLPRPIQSELPVWITTAGSEDTYRRAGDLGANVLTHLLGQSISDLEPKIKAYREARAKAGHAGDGTVTLMLHTFVGDDEDRVRQAVEEPLKAYLGASMSLLKQHASTFFAAFTRQQGVESSSLDDVIATLTDEERTAMLQFAFERYFSDGGLMGSSDRCAQRLADISAVGVDEVACLVDFGVPPDAVLESLPALARLRDRVRAEAADGLAEPEAEPLLPPAASLVDLLERHEVTHLQCTPSMARMITLMEGGDRALPTVRHLLIGGEAFPPLLARDLLSMAPDTQIVNMYGPTETTIWSSTHEVTDGGGSIPIGKPIANTQLYVLDDDLQPTPVGVPGELFIGGTGVARGYLDREELTGARFLPNPFLDGGRIYRTGDRARWQHDGTVSFLGRADDQLKIHGHRVEPGDIEAALTRMHGVVEAVVVSRENGPGDMRLVSFVVADGPAPSMPAMRDHLRQLLPEYMVPAHFAVLDRLPKTPNGKVDRNALPELGAVAASQPVAFAAPGSALQEDLAGLWCRLLGLETVGIDDNFFDVGGHSLLVVGLHRELRGLGLEKVSLTDLYRFPTIRSLSSHLNADGASTAQAGTGVDRASKRKAAARRRRQPDQNR